MIERILTGKKTHIANLVRAGAMLAGMAGYAIDPDAVIQWLDKFIYAVAGFEVLMAAAIAWFRELGKRG